MIKSLKILSTKRKLKKLEKYILKKLAYHEAGHLVFSYLINIPCNHALVQYGKVSPIKLIDDNLQVEYESKSHVHHQLPEQMEFLLKHSRYGIDKLSQKLNIPMTQSWSIIRQYLTILLAGYKSQFYFFKNYLNPELERFESDFGQNLSELDPNEDKNRMINLMHSLTQDYDLKNTVARQVTNLIDEYLDKKEVQKAIESIARALLKNKRINQNQIEEILDNIGFLDYAISQTELINERL